MADKIKKTDIYIQKEEGNLMVIDPNKVYDENQKPIDRYVPQEELVYFVNLEANPVPRSILDLGADVNSNRTVVAYGKVNYLGPNGGKPMDTAWTEDFQGKKNNKTAIADSEREYYSGYVDYDYITNNQYDTQLLGIKDISIQTKPDSLRTSIITLRMVDVRGRALFEKGPASIYSTFFHLPYPQFYLTVKGYYGEAITYQMVLSNQVKVSFESDGDYYITATFMATNQKLLNDIRLGDADVAPYLFEYERTTTDVDGVIKTCRSTRGFDILRQVYQNYAKEGLVDDKLAEKPLTIPQLMDLVDRLSTFLEDNMFEKTDISFFSDIALYGKTLENFNRAVNGWFTTYTNTTNPITVPDSDIRYVEFKKEYENGLKKVTRSGTEVTIDLIEGGDIETLFQIFETKKKELSEINYFGKTKKLEVNINSGGDKKREITYNPPSLSNLSKSDFYYNKSKKQMTITTFIKKLEEVFNQYNKAFDDIKNQMEEVLSTIQYNELGFTPTLKNVMGVILANTETFLRVMEYTHKLSYDQRSHPDRLKSIDDKDNPDSINNVVYPFPTVYARNKDNNVEEFYPGDPSIREQIKSYNVETWPEVKLVEDYVTAHIGLGETVSSEFCFDTTEKLGVTQENALMSGIFANDIYNNLTIYDETSYIGLVYRIYNRAIYSVFGTGYSKDTIRLLGIADAKNATIPINKLLNGKSFFKNGPVNFRGLYGDNFLPRDITLYEDAKQNLLTDSTEKYTEDRNSYTVLTLSDIKTKSFENSEEVLLKESESYKVTGLEPYPFSNNDWVQNNLKVKSNIFNRKISTKYDDTLRYTYTSADKDITYGEFFTVNAWNPLQTPGFVTSTSDVLRAFWLLNTIPTRELTGVYEDGSLKENYFARFMGGDVKQINKIQLLKWGAIWYRYVTNLETGVDILDDIWKNLDISQYNGQTINALSHTFVYDKTAPKFDIGFYPELVIQKLNELISDEEFVLGDIESLISSGRLVVKKVEDIKVTDTNQVINLWRSYFIKDETIIRLPSFASFTNGDITANKIDMYINMSVSEDWYSLQDWSLRFEIDFNDPTVTKPTTEQYIFNEEGTYGGNKSIEVLTSLFSYETLDSFKNEFLLFAKNLNECKEGETSYQEIYHPFVIMDGINDDETLPEKIQTYSKDNVEGIFKNSGINEDIFIVLDKPLNISFSILSSFVNSQVTNPISFAEYTTQDNDLFKKIIGPVKNQTVQSIKESFFSVANIDASEENMKKFKGIINIWAEWKLTNTGGDIDGFKSFLIDIVNRSMDKMDTYISEMFSQLSKTINQDDKNIAEDKLVSDMSGSVDLQKVVYRNLKNINDTWIGGFNWEKSNLAKLFKYINYLNEPIGDKFIMDLRVLKSFYNETNKSKSIGSFISQLFKDNSLSEPISFASNINFYGNLTNDSKNVDDSKKVANSIFGTHTNVRKNGLPGFVVFFRSNASEYLKIKKPNFGYQDDSMDLSSSKPNPISSKNPDQIQIREGGRGIAFNVDFGIQHQNMFNDFNIQSYDGIKSGEELIITEEIANMKKGSTMATISTNLLDVMKTRVYSCTIKMMGNAMIQPFMYFNLRYIPIYSGTYMILSVEHSLSPDSGMITQFTGVRVSKAGISNIDKGMVKARRNLLENLIDKLKTKSNKVKEEKQSPEYPGDTNNQGNNDNSRNGGQSDVNCRLGSSWGNLTKYSVPGNYTVLSNTELKQIILNASERLNLSAIGKQNIARFAFSVAKREQGRGNGVRFLYDNPFGLHVDGNGSSIFKSQVKGYFCPNTSDGYRRATAVFHNVGTESVNVGVGNAFYAFMFSMIDRGNTYFNNTNFWNSDSAIDSVYLASLWRFNWNTSYRAVDDPNAKGKLVSTYISEGKSIVRYKNGTTKDVSKDSSSFNGFMSTFNKS